MVRIPRWSLLLQCVFFGFAFWFICVVNRDYLFLLQEYNFFLASFPFLAEHLTRVGGPLDYVSRFLAQLFLWSYLGGWILVLLLILIRKQTERLFRLTGKGMILSFVPSFLLLWFFTQPGYVIFGDARMYALYAAFIGILLALSFAVWYAQIASPIRRSVFGSLGTILLYCLAGAYGLLGTLFCLYRECSFPRPQRNLTSCAFPVLCGLVTPFLLCWFQWTKTNFFNAYRVGLPDRLTTGYDGFLFDPIIAEMYILLASLLAFAVLHLVGNSEWIRRIFRRGKPNTPNPPSKDVPVMTGSSRSSEEEASGRVNEINFRFAALNVILLVLICCALYAFSHTRGDFLITAKMCRLICEEDWEGILQVQYADENPMFPITLFRHLALFKLDRIADEVFAYPTIQSMDAEHMIWVRSNRVFSDHLLFEYGLVNMAYRMAMVQYATKESTISNLRMLTLSAMANEEYEVAEKYLRLIKQSPFYRRWAQNHLDYIDSRRSSDQAAAESVSEAVQRIEQRLNNIRRLMPVMNTAEWTRDIEALILQGFLRKDIEEAPREVRNMFLVQLLLSKELGSFQRYYDRWADELYADRIPRYFQEALILDVSQENVAARAAQYGISPDLKNKFDLFLRTFEPTARSGAAVDSRSVLSREFGDTFWYYLLLK